MTPRPGLPANRQASIALCLILACASVAVLCVAKADAAYYKSLLCAGNVGSNAFTTATNTASPSNPGGIFTFENWCGPAPDPAGNAAYARIVENQAAGSAGVNAYGSMSWTTPGFVTIAAAGGYTREPYAFNDGWRGRFWAEGYDGSTNNILMQGAGVANGSLGGIGWSPTSTFAPHLWPFGGYGVYRRFVFELTCVRPSGCDRANYNAVDANTFNLTLNDVDPSHVWLTNAGSGFLAGQWTRGSQAVTWATSDQGSGLRFERVRIDGSQKHVVDLGGSCNLGWTGTSGEFARVFQPCPVGGPFGRSFGVDTAALADGAHLVQVCSQDYGQASSGGESCDQRTVRTDNTAPGAPSGLVVTSSNPNRYLPDFGAQFSLPPNQGSPIAKVHYNVVNAAGEVVQPMATLIATNPSVLSGIEGPAKAGNYRLRVWLEDEVGHVGPAATAEIPRDTTPPSAPQGLRVAAASTERWVASLGLRWLDPSDGGSPIETAHYQLVSGAGEAVGPTRVASEPRIQAIDGITTPARPGDYALRVWLTDAEGNVGSAASVPLPRDTTPPAAPQAVSVTPPSVPRSKDGFDLRWANLPDAGSPITAAHYEVLDEAGRRASSGTLQGPNVQAIPNLASPRGRGAHAVRLWLSDAEANVGAPVTVPLSYSCVRSEVAGAEALWSAIAPRGRKRILVRQGKGASLRGRLLGGGAGIAGAPVCVFARVVTDAGAEFLGIAMTDAEGRYRFPVPAGPSRQLSAVHRVGHRELADEVRVVTRVRPVFKLRKGVVKNKRFARFFGRIPGPHNDRVVVVAQVRKGKGWLAFRRFRTRAGGKLWFKYLFTRTDRPTRYEFRLQVRSQGGYPYRQGTSRIRKLVVLPAGARRGG